jgi:ergothioneine biosynthesis protein EgtB
MIDPAAIVARFVEVRARTERLAAPLSAEDQQLQAMASASPTKWHRGHTTWFFETFLLAPHGVPAEHPTWAVLFNSYYESLGPRHTRAERGLLSRPTAAEIGVWRRLVDERVLTLLDRLDGDAWSTVAPIVELGLAHEEQHQELILTDIVAAFARHPARPVYDASFPIPDRHGGAVRWIEHAGGKGTIGAPEGGATFAFDNESPRHDVWLEPFEIADRLVTVGEWTAFAADGGYETPSLWLSDGLELVRAQRLRAPAYTERDGEVVSVFGLSGDRVAHPDEPVIHLSFYEADALATWLGGRLPTEAEWEIAADHLGQRDAVAWQWTRSSYAPYPRYRPSAGAIGEYNGKFMVNQLVLRGGSDCTPPGHTRPTYRNFWYPDTRFQRTGLRLARDPSRGRSS